MQYRGAHEKRIISRSLTAISTAATATTTAAITTAGTTTTTTATAHWAMIARATARAATVLLTVEPPPPRGTRPRRLPPKLRLLVISSRKPGISCPVSASRRTSPFATLRFFSLKKEVAVPRLPIRPVRPMRCTYSSTSAGRSKLITCFTFGMSSPRAATAVATRIGQRPQRNRRSASSRSACVRSPWMLVTGKLWLYRNSSSESAAFFVSTKISVRQFSSSPSFSLVMFDSRSSRCERLMFSSTQKIVCVMLTEVEPTRPTARKM
uniref:Uncharacterized protein n=1 Tax=Anopheles merus TaxID=30066 RepID=A0A182VF21_ANOME